MPGSGPGIGVRVAPPDGVTVRLHVSDSLIRDNGLTARVINAKWPDLRRLRRSLPAILCLRDGRIQCQGPPGEVLKPEVLSQTFGTDMEQFQHYHAH